MQKFVLVSFLFVAIGSFAQNDTKVLNEELAPFVVQCNEIGNAIINKAEATTLADWYEGPDADRLTAELRAFEAFIDNSKLEVTYYLQVLSDNPLIYSFHFANNETKTEFGQMFIHFKDQANLMVDDLKLLNKEQMELIDKNYGSSSLPTNIPPPPPPPGKKKKNE